MTSQPIYVVTIKNINRLKIKYTSNKYKIVQIFFKSGGSVVMTQIYIYIYLGPYGNLIVGNSSNNFSSFLGFDI